MAPGLTGYVCSCLLAFVVLMVVATMHLLAWFQLSVTDYELYRAREDEHWQSKLETLNLLLPTWIFPLWIVLYVWQGIWILYGLHLIIMEQRAGWLYHKQSLVPPSTYLSCAIAVAAQLGWVVLWDNAVYSNYAPLCLLASCAFNFLGLGRSLSKCVRYAAMMKVTFTPEIVLSRILTHNGIAYAASWIVVVIVYHLSFLLCQGGYLTPSYAGFVFLGVLLGYEIILFTADLFLARHLTAGLLSPYVVLAITFTQSVLINFTNESHMFMVSLVMLGFSVMLFLTKLVVDIQRVSFGRDKY